MLTLVGCNAVHTEGMDAFGVVWSAEWIHWKKADRQSLVLSNVVGYCRKQQNYQDALQAWGEAHDEFDGSSDDYCSVMYEATMAVADAGWELERAHSPTLTLFPADAGFEEGVYDIPDEGGGNIDDNVTNPWEVLRWRYDVDSDEQGNLFEGGACGASYQDSSHWLARGTFEVTEARDQGVLAGTFDVHLFVDAESATGRFRASACAIDEADDVYEAYDADHEDHDDGGR